MAGHHGYFNPDGCTNLFPVRTFAVGDNGLLGNGSDTDRLVGVNLDRLGVPPATPGSVRS
jgi:hypothetical protein